MPHRSSTPRSSTLCSTRRLDTRLNTHGAASRSCMWYTSPLSCRGRLLPCPLLPSLPLPPRHLAARARGAARQAAQPFRVRVAFPWRWKPGIPGKQYLVSLSSRASASPSPSTHGATDTDTDGDRDVDMAAPAPAPAAPIHHAGRGRVGDSSASARPSPPPLNAHLNINVSTAPPRSCRHPHPFTSTPTLADSTSTLLDSTSHLRPINGTLAPRVSPCARPRYTLTPALLPHHAPAALELGVTSPGLPTPSLCAHLHDHPRPTRPESTLEASMFALHPARLMESTQLAASAPSAGATEWGRHFQRTVASNGLDERLAPIRECPALPVCAQAHLCRAILYLSDVATSHLHGARPPAAGAEPAPFPNLGCRFSAARADIGVTHHCRDASALVALRTAATRLLTPLPPQLRPNAAGLVHCMSTSRSNPARSTSHPRRLSSPLARVGGAIPLLRSTRTQSSLHTGVLSTFSCVANPTSRILLYACSFSCMWSPRRRSLSLSGEIEITGAALGSTTRRRPAPDSPATTRRLDAGGIDDPLLVNIPLDSTPVSAPVAPPHAAAHTAAPPHLTLSSRKPMLSAPVTGWCKCSSLSRRDAACTIPIPLRPASCGAPPRFSTHEPAFSRGHRTWPRMGGDNLDQLLPAIQHNTSTRDEESDRAPVHPSRSHSPSHILAWAFSSRFWRTTSTRAACAVGDNVSAGPWHSFFVLDSSERITARRCAALAAGLLRALADTHARSFNVHARGLYVKAVLDSTSHLCPINGTLAPRVSPCARPRYTLMPALLPHRAPARLSLALPALAFRLRARVHIRTTTCTQVPAGLAHAARPLRLDVRA
ncbi:hypothetical protein B0H14DRAFT_3867586 [Mycena olivaceomarginata]|nr:hypothetical protein B0H14DRAFT_3867586 [Mycena olivaceomarginata]